MRAPLGAAGAPRTACARRGTSKVRRFPAAPAEGGNVRRWIRSVVGDHPCLDDVLLIVAELFDNAIEHGATTKNQLVTVVVCRLTGGRFYVSVTDPGHPRRTVPTRRNAGASDLRGRGIALVDDLSAHWGSRPYGSGTGVRTHRARRWAVIGMPHATQSRNGRRTHGRRRPPGGEVRRRPGNGNAGRRLICTGETGDRMPQPHKVTDFLYRRFEEAGVTGMLRGHTARLAVLLVHDGFVIWSDGRTVWWQPAGIPGRRPIPAPDLLWRRAYGRYMAGPGAPARESG